MWIWSNVWNKQDTLVRKLVSRWMVFQKSEAKLRKDINWPGDQMKTTPEDHELSMTRSHDKPSTFLQNRGNLTLNFGRKLKKKCDWQVVFLTLKVRTCLPTLISSFDRNLKFHVFNEVKCNGCGSIYVGQTNRHVTTRKSKHQKKGSLMGHRLVECSHSTNDFECKILDDSRTVEKLFTIEIIYINKLKLGINALDEHSVGNSR